MSKKNVFILGASSDIGTALVERFVRSDHNVIGTYRDINRIQHLIKIPGCNFLHCDVSDPKSIRAAVHEYEDMSLTWDIFISSIGLTEPIGSFFSCDFDAWEQSVIINSTAQLRMLHTLYNYRRKGQVSNAVFFAGGGTNNPFTNYSAYCVSKILLIKMCELLDDENKDLNTFIVGPGWVRTKIHQQTLSNPEAAGHNFERVADFMNSQNIGTSMDDIFDCINWCISKGRDVTGGRNFSVVHDPWRGGGEELAKQLKERTNKFKLRRQND